MVVDLLGENWGTSLENTLAIMLPKVSSLRVLGVKTVSDLLTSATDYDF